MKLVSLCFFVVVAALLSSIAPTHAVEIEQHFIDLLNSRMDEIRNSLSSPDAPLTDVEVAAQVQSFLNDLQELDIPNDLEVQKYALKAKSLHAKLDSIMNSDLEVSEKKKQLLDLQEEAQWLWDSLKRGARAVGNAVASVGKQAYDFYDKHHKVIHAVASVACAKCLLLNKALSTVKTIHTGVQTAKKVVDTTKWAVGCMEAPGQCARDFISEKAKSWVGDKVSEFAGANLHRVGLSKENVKQLENRLGKDAFKFAKDTAVSKFEGARDSMISRAHDAITRPRDNAQASEEIAVVQQAERVRRQALARLQATQRVEQVQREQVKAASQAEVALIIAERDAEKIRSPTPVVTDDLEVESDAEDDDDLENLYDDHD
jgi:hypothetical protein